MSQPHHSSAERGTLPETVGADTRPGESNEGTHSSAGRKRERSRSPPAQAAPVTAIAVSSVSLSDLPGGSYTAFESIELVVLPEDPQGEHGEAVPADIDTEPTTSKRRVEPGDLAPEAPSRSHGHLHHDSVASVACFPAAPVGYSGVSTPTLPQPQSCASSTTAKVEQAPSTASPSLVKLVSPVSPPAVGRVPRKTPISTPGSSSLAAPTPPHVPSPASSSVHSATAGAHKGPADAKRAARIERWVELLLPVMMLERGTHEEPAVRDLCTRIAGAVPGERQEAKDTFLMLLVNLKDPKNHELRKRIVDGALPVEVLVTLGERDLINPERRKILDEEFEERAKDTNLVEIRKASMTSSTLFPCPKCKAKDCTWTQKQTRSADEPMTVFCTCNKCGNVWKKY